MILSIISQIFPLLKTLPEILPIIIHNIIENFKKLKSPAYDNITNTSLKHLPVNCIIYIINHANAIPIYPYPFILIILNHKKLLLSRLFLNLKLVFRILLVTFVQFHFVLLSVKLLSVSIGPSFTTI